jgi:hypothetical protein
MKQNSRILNLKYENKHTTEIMCVHKPGAVTLQEE